MKKQYITLLILLGLAGIVNAAPSFTVSRTIVPEVTNTYDLGSLTKVWKNLFVKNLTVNSTSTLATTTTSSLNGMIVVDGVHYAKTGDGVIAAVNDCQAITCNEIFVPAGTYTFTSAITAYSGMHLIGSGASTTKFVLANNANTNLVTSVSTGLDDVFISSIDFDGNGANQTGAGAANALINLAGNSHYLKNVFVDHIMIENAYKVCIFFHGDDTTYAPKGISYSYVNNCGVGAIGFGIYADHAPNTTIAYNYINNTNANHSDAIEMGNTGHILAIGNRVWGGQLQFPFASDSTIADNWVYGTTIQNDANTANNMVITGNHVIYASPTVGFAAISLLGASSTISDNVINVQAFDGVRVTIGNGNTISNNQIYSTSTVVNGINTGNSSGNTITGNSVSGTFSACIHVVFDNNIVTGNTLNGCTTGVDFSDSTVSGHVMTGNIIQFNNILSTVTFPLVRHNQSNSTNVFSGFSLGNLSIGTSTPYSKLSIWGNSTGNIFEAVTSASSSALTVSGTGFATTTVTGLTVNGSATSTSNVGYNITTGCYAIGNICLTQGITSEVDPLSLHLTDWYSTTTQKTISSLPALSITKSQVSDFGGPYVTLVTGTWPIISSGGATPNLTFGWATTSQPASSNLFVSNGANGFYGVGTSTLTASSPLTGSFTQVGSGGSVGCATASSGVAGCLSNTAFDTFNNKQAAITATWPQILTGSALTFGGLSTTTNFTQGQIPYITGVNTFGQVATTTASCAGTDSCTSFTIIGSSPVTITGNGGSGTVSSGLAGQLAWYSANGTTIVGSSTGQLTVGSLLATSTTATSTIGLALGIGSTTPWAALSVSTTTVGTPAFAVGNSSVSEFIVDQNGKVGIGTAAPTAAAEIYGTDSLSTNGLAVELGVYNSAAAQVDRGGYIALGGQSAAATFTTFGAIKGAKENVTAANTSGYLGFYTRTNAAALTTERMRLDSTGNLSIGTSTAAYRLTVASTTGSQLALSAGSGIAQWAFRNAGGNLYFSTTTVVGNATTSTAALTILNNGNTGISSTTPGSTLDVLGTTLHYVNSGSGVPLTAIVDSSVATQNALYVSDFTNFAHAGSIALIKSVNGSDTGTTTQIQNAGTGRSFEVDDVANDTSPFVIDNAGNVGISSTTPTATLGVAGTISAVLTTFATGDSAVCQRGVGGLITADAGVSSCIVSSKYVKTDIVDNSFEAAQARLAKLDPKTFTYIDTQKQDIGLIAEEAAQVDPRYAEYATAPRDMDGHHYNVGDPVAINWTAIQADMLTVMQHQTGKPDTSTNYWPYILGGFILYVGYNEFTKRRN